jgi:asparagine synthase (glutamine-hydrolysing)
MSAIAGIHGFGGVPAEPALLARMSSALARRGPDGSGWWIDGAVGLAHRLLRTTPEALPEAHPVCDERTGSRIVLDGRLDNRQELIAALDASGMPPRRDRSDPELILDGYLGWGEKVFSRLAGDFALAIWDRPARQLVCARDPLGAKPFYYHANAERLVFASAITAILRDPAVAVGPDDRTIADFLLMDFRDHAATFFDGIRQLPPGHLLQTGPAGTKLVRYWEVDASRSTSPDDDYLDHFRALFAEAVRCRLRSEAPVGAWLSGGIDSTAVAAMAGALRQADASLPALLGVTVLYDGFLGEERAAIQALRRAYGTTVRAIPPEEGGRRLTDFEAFLGRSESPHYEAFITVPLAMAPLAERGCRSVLTGFGADELIGSGEVGFLHDLLREWSLFAFAREARRLAAAYGASGPGTGVKLVWTGLPHGVRRVVKRAAGRGVPRWIAPGFASRLGDRGAPRTPRMFPTMCQEASYRAITEPAFAQALTTMDAAAAAHSMEVRHPFLDRRLIEFFLSVPGAPKVRRGYRKMFLQQALRPISPWPVRPAETNEMLVPPMPPEVWRSVDEARLREILFHPGALVFEYVDRREAERIRDRYLAGEVRCRNLLWRFAALEHWLQDFVGARR